MKHLIAILTISMSMEAQTIEPPSTVTKVHSFNDQTNLALFSADALVRTLDWQSTRMNLSNPCQCFHEDYLPQSVAGSSGAMLAYSLGVSGAIHGASWIAHKTGHHKIERILPMIDIAYDGELVGRNYAISGRRPKR